MMLSADWRVEHLGNMELSAIERPPCNLGNGSYLSLPVCPGEHA